MKKITNKEVFRKLVIMDFDGTLIDTQTPEEGKGIWKEKTGNDWPHKGWWGRKESLDMDVFEHPPIPRVKAEYDKDSGKEENLMVMLTGRRRKLSAEVEKIIHANDMCFHKYLYNYGSDTLSNKIEQVGKLLDEFEGIEFVAMFEDRDEHIPHFKQMLEEYVDKKRIIGYEIVHITDSDRGR